MDQLDQEVPQADPSRILDVLYCGNCGLPPEYCEFGSTLTECKTWLKLTNASLFDQIYGSVEKVQEDVAGLSLESSEKPSEESPKQQRKKPQPAKKVLITTIERTKRKRVTVVMGLDKFGIDLKKAAKQFATKFASGASVTKAPQGHDEIVMQGEFADDLAELIPSIWPEVSASLIEFGETKKK